MQAPDKHSQPRAYEEIPLCGADPEALKRKLLARGILFVTEYAARNCGDLTRIKVGAESDEMVLLAHPDYIQEWRLNHLNYKKFVTELPALIGKQFLGNALISVEGDEWKKVKTMIFPLVNLQMERFIEPTTRATLRLAKKWEESDKPSDVYVDCNDLVFDAMKEIILGEPAEENDPFRKLLAGFYGTFFKLVSSMNQQEALDGAKDRIGALNVEIDDYIRANIARMGDKPSLLSQLCQLKDQETGENLKFETIRNQVLGLMAASVENTGTLLGWLLHMTGKYPEATEEVAEQLDATSTKQAPTPDEIGKLTKLRAFIHETMRVQPVTPLIERKTVEETTIGGFRIPAKTNLLIAPFLIHKDERFWPEPEKFDIHRFLGAPPVRNTFIPFGVGPQACIGERMSMMQFQLVLSILLKKFRWKSVEGHPVVADHRLNTMPRHGLMMHILKRRNGKWKP